ncbi:class I SAM-dependent methyltransferase [Shinella sp. DD12]|uniref:class I SAM-dependent methyltransferase n=1 Tax=Shinella sp. DD12 TaxID=1410620 RepID=UPI0003C56959|nr:class I SAM-dependent methyltransferase [Shinella sp. DD12]EYR83786.1 methylase involved in ubiquinone/menaquinone biosynthesis [Shinella sp. DD12]
MSDMYDMFVRPRGQLGEQAGIMMARTGRPMARIAVDWLALQPSDRVLEIGFGPGVGLELISALVREGQVSGVDPSATMQRQAADRNAEAIREGRVKLFEGTVDALPFDNDTFDAGLAIDNMHFWQDRLGGLVELRRVLRAGARFVAAFTPPSGGGMHGMPELFERAGYADISVEPAEFGVSLFARVVK